MIFFMFRLIMLGGFIALIYFLVKSFTKPSEFVKCGRCEAKDSGMPHVAKKPATGAVAPANFPAIPIVRKLNTLNVDHYYLPDGLT